ncbi:MAG: alpha/beta fold hydrolase [Lentisphaeraceae bacterium]|nr:alpha/beta fold hydrolase [Lentisphaeraceae bacterium]
MILRDHKFTVPLNYKNPQGAAIEVFGREVVDADRDKDKLPWLIFFQGGPGFPSPRVTGKDGWLGEALKNYRIFLLDQRGTGLSTPIENLAHFSSPQEQADYLSNFRVDNIINDSEFIRQELNIKQWTALGQSYGGFCIMRYLSVAPESIKEAFITGGVPSIERHIDDVYRETYKFCKNKSREYFAHYPEDAELLKRIARHLNENDVYLPCGEKLSFRRLQNIGASLGFAAGFDRIHYLIEDAFIQGPDGEELSFNFLRNMENYFAFNTNPIFGVLHEAIYTENYAANWSAERVRELYPEFEQFEDEFLFTGEMIGPWMFDEYNTLKEMKDAAEILAQKSDWPAIYDLEKLAQNTVPVACAVYYNDMFVNQQYSMETINSVPAMKAWVTSEYEHCGLGVDGARVFARLRDMARNHLDS